MSQITPQPQSEETISFKIQRKCENFNNEMDEIIKEKGKMETKILYTTIEKGEEFNKIFYH